MGFFTKNWETRLNETINTIGLRAAFVKSASGLIRDIESKLANWPDSARKELSNSLHLQKQGTAELRQCWRAIALIEALYFHNPREIGQIVKAERNPTAESVQRTLDLFITSTWVFGYRERPAYHWYTAALLARLLEGNEKISSLICQCSVARCIQLASANRWSKLSPGNDEIDKTFFRGNRERYLVDDIEAVQTDSVVVVYRRADPKNRPSEFSTYSHTMIKVDVGVCMGSNNGCIGGSSTFSQVKLSEYFARAKDSRFIYNLIHPKMTQNSRQDLARVFYARRVDELIADR